MDNENLVEEIAAYLEENVDGAELLDMMLQASACDGSFEELSSFDFKDAASAAKDTYEFGRSIVYGNVTNVDDPVRYNAYGNLESVSEYELQSEAGDMIHEFADWLATSGWGTDIDLPRELKELVEKADER